MELCSFGCGQQAKTKLKNGKWICSNSKNQCPKLRRKNSLGGRTVILKECTYCKNKISQFQIRIHESCCYLNPINIKLCPVCNGPIKNYKNTKTCSWKCANSLFKHIGSDHWNYKGNNTYRDICFKYHRSRCLICNEEYFVNAHHMDENRSNNNPENLVPLCLNHHWYMHSKHKILIEEKILKYLEEFKKGDGTAWGGRLACTENIQESSNLSSSTRT